MKTKIPQEGKDELTHKPGDQVFLIFSCQDKKSKDFRKSAPKQFTIRKAHWYVGEPVYYMQNLWGGFAECEVFASKDQAQAQADEFNAEALKFITIEQQTELIIQAASNQTITPATIAKLINQPPHYVHKLLQTLLEKGRLEKPRRGCYAATFKGRKWLEDQIYHTGSHRNWWALPHQ